MSGHPDSRRIVVTIELESERADLALLRALARDGVAISRARLKTLFAAELVTLADRPILPSRFLPPGSHELSIRDFGALETADAAARASIHGCFLPVLYEDESLLMMHKHSGVPSVPHSADETETAVGAALARAPSIASAGGKPLEPGALHRLDTATSGILLFAKTAAERERLRVVWREHRVQKFYRAIVAPAPKPGAAVRLGHSPRPRLAPPPFPSAPARVDFPLAHDASSARRMIALPVDFAAGQVTGNDPRIRGKPLPAVTHLLGTRPLAPLRDSQDDFPPGALEVEIRIETGVMHQIRCHLAAVAWPIVGDPIYGGTRAPGSRGRLWLHAERLEIPLRSGQWLSVRAALPLGWPDPKSDHFFGA